MTKLGRRPQESLEDFHFFTESYGPYEYKNNEYKDGVKDAGKAVENRSPCPKIIASRLRDVLG